MQENHNHEPHADRPTSDTFVVKMNNIPHGFVDPSPRGFDWFERGVNSDIRYYYRQIRNGVYIEDHEPIGKTGITAGELALYIIQRNHQKRKSRY